RLGSRNAASNLSRSPSRQNLIQPTRQNSGHHSRQNSGRFSRQNSVTLDPESLV
ncbi:unnamed protein product, partial [Aphanomyces euteiches]